MVVVKCPPENWENHPLLKSRPNFGRAYSDFQAFLEVTKADLQSKKEALENERSSLKSSKSLASRRIRHYLSCQLFMLRKHASRLEIFEREITDRLNGVLKIVEKEDEVSDSAQTSAEQDSCDQQLTTAAASTTTLTAINCDEADPTRFSDIETKISLERLGLGDRVPDIVVIEEEDEHVVADDNHSTDFEDPDKIEVQSEAESTSSSKIIQSDSLSVRSGNSSLQSSESGSSGFQISCHSNEDSFDSSVSTSTNSSSCIINNNNNNSPTKIDEDEPEIVSERLMLEQELMAAKDTQLLQLLADMNKMKRRCKHILDVTDRYCVLRPDLATPCEPDGSSPVPSTESGVRSGAASPDLRSPLTSLPDPISQHLMRTTLESLGNHLAVIAKTYTRRHSHELAASSPKSPTGVAL